MFGRSQQTELSNCEIGEKVFTTRPDLHNTQVNKGCLSSKLTANVKIEEIPIDLSPSDVIKFKTNEIDHLTAHSERHTETKPYSCEIDIKTLKTSAEFHKNQTNNECLSSEFTTNVKTEVKIEETSNDSIYNPVEVWIKTEETSEIEDHVIETNLTEHLTAKTHSRTKPYSCETGEKTYLTSTDLHKHQFNKRCMPSELTASVKNEDISTNSNMSEVWIKTEKSPEINKDATITKVQDDLKVHLRMHTDINPYKCELCEKEYTQYRQLKVHLRTHTGFKPYKCKVCEKRFTEKSSVKVHLRTHTGIKPYKCELCEKQFTQIQSLKRHFQAHTGIKLYTCEICEKQFTQNNSLKVHLRIHTGIKPHTCKVCGNRFTEKKSLKRHLKTHSGIKSYTCEICEKQFTRNDCLKVHLQRHTEIKP